MVLHLKRLESLSPKDAMCQVWLKLALWFWRRRFFNFVNVFLLFHNYVLLEKGRALHLNKLEFPSPKDAMCQVWLKMAMWFLRTVLNFVEIFSQFRNHLFFYLNKLPLSQECFVLSLVEIGPLVLEKKMKMSKVYRQTDGQKDDGRQAFRKADELSAQAS